MFSIGSEKTIWLKCTECGKSYQIKVKDAYKKRTTKCIECAYLKLKPGVNDFKTMYPKLAEEYDYERNEIRLEKLNLSERDSKFYWICKNVVTNGKHQLKVGYIVQIALDVLLL